MKKSSQPDQPIHLNHYFFPVISVFANPNYRPEQAEGKAPPELGIEVCLAPRDDHLYEVQLDLKIKNTEENPSQYDVWLKAIGIFTVDPSLPNKESVVKTAGTSILYSASREFLLGLMLRGPWNPIMLNLIFFKPEKEAPNEAPAEEQKEIKGKRANKGGCE